jgi:hypothetical protein
MTVAERWCDADRRPNPSGVRKGRQARQVIDVLAGFAFQPLTAAAASPFWAGLRVKLKFCLVGRV